MADQAINLGINLDELESQIQSLSPEDIKKQLVELRTKQRVQQKKYHNPERAKAYQQKRAAKSKAMVEAAKALPATDSRYKTMYDQILAEAAEKADEILAAADAGEDAVE
jgi:Na+-transporting NADH:ubiquinone oxidoreductase subunit NqrC